MKKLNIVVPMSGRGQRFAEAGYSEPKPVIDVNGEPMISLVTKNLTPKGYENYEFIYICQDEHYQKYDLENVLRRASGDKCQIIKINKITEGAACTVLLASELINNDDELIIANSDQYIEPNAVDDWYYRTLHTAADGLIMTFKSENVKWSYARTDESGIVQEVAEKTVISNNASTGIYWFKHGKDFVESASKMIGKNIRHNNEFYVCPIFNEMILADKIVKIHEINVEQMHGLGTPIDLQNYLNLTKKT